MKIVPFKNFPSFIEEITLDDIPYILRFDWNSRGQFWSMDVYDRESNPLLTGRKVTLFFELLKQFPDRGLPPGELYIVDQSLSDFSPIKQYDFFLERVSLVYLEEEEIAAL